MKFLVFLEHYLGRLDHDLDDVAFFERHLFRAAASNYAFDQVVADFYADVSHYSAEMNFLNGTFELVASRKCHAPRLTASITCK